MTTEEETKVENEVSMQKAERERGRVTFFKKKDGFGFIAVPDDPVFVYFHIADMHEQDRVLAAPKLHLEFTRERVKQRGKKDRAIEIELVGVEGAE